MSGVSSASQALTGYEPKSLKPPVFNGNDFGVWKFKMSAFLDAQGLLPLVTVPEISDEESKDSKNRAPTPKKDKNSQSSSSSSSSSSSGEQVSKFLALKKTAYFYLVNSIGENVIHLIRSAPNGEPHAVWHLLLANYERSTVASKASLRRQLYSNRMKEQESFSVFINRINELVRTLKGMGEHISDSECFAVVLNGLRPDFDPIVVHLEVSEVDYNTACNHIRDYEVKLNLRNKSSEQLPIEANYARSSSRTNRGPIVCHHCKKPGHVQSKCWVKFPEQRPEGSIPSVCSSPISQVQVSRPRSCFLLLLIGLVYRWSFFYFLQFIL